MASVVFSVAFSLSDVNNPIFLPASKITTAPKRIAAIMAKIVVILSILESSSSSSSSSSSYLDECGFSSIFLGRFFFDGEDLELSELLRTRIASSIESCFLDCFLICRISCSLIRRVDASSSGSTIFTKSSSGCINERFKSSISSAID